MPRRPKPKNALSAGERAALYEAEQAERRAHIQEKADETGDPIEASKSRKDREAEKVKEELQKPQYATVKVDLSMSTGRVKPMHAMCNGPVSYGSDISSLFKEIGVPYVRFDGADTPISAYAIDVSKIFKDLSADPRNAENYDFSYTDKYIAAAHNAGARVILRLGESIDRFIGEKQAIYPSDMDTYVDACIGIIRHYNYNWANGYAYGIKYFEIWSVSDKSSGDRLDRDFEIYKRLASSVKLLSEDIKVGGMCFGASSRQQREFFRFCRRTRAPLDFLTVSSFASDPHEACEEIKKTVPLLYELGFHRTEIIIGAWSFIDTEAIRDIPLERILGNGGGAYSDEQKKLFESQSSVKGASYALAFMISLCELREAAMACLYDAQPMLSPWCAICDRYGNPSKTFYAFKAYGELYRAGNTLYALQDEPEGFAHSGIYSMAAEGRDAKYILISSFDGCGIVDLRLESIPSDIYTAEIYMLDGVKNMTLADQVPISGDKKRLILNISRYGAAMVKLC